MIAINPFIRKPAYAEPRLPPAHSFNTPDDITRGIPEFWASAILELRMSRGRRFKTGTKERLVRMIKLYGPFPAGGINRFAGVIDAFLDAEEIAVRLPWGMKVPKP